MAERDEMLAEKAMGFYDQGTVIDLIKMVVDSAQDLGVSYLELAVACDAIAKTCVREMESMAEKVTDEMINGKR